MHTFTPPWHQHLPPNTLPPKLEVLFYTQPGIDIFRPVLLQLRSGIKHQQRNHFSVIHLLHLQALEAISSWILKAHTMCACFDALNT